eukprot:987751-Prymnesium_polylepis.1
MSHARAQGNCPSRAQKTKAGKARRAHTQSTVSQCAAPRAARVGERCVGGRQACGCGARAGCRVSRVSSLVPRWCDVSRLSVCARGAGQCVQRIALCVCGGGAGRSRGGHPAHRHTIRSVQLGPVYATARRTAHSRPRAGHPACRSRSRVR